MRWFLALKSRDVSEPRWSSAQCTSAATATRTVTYIRASSMGMAGLSVPIMPPGPDFSQESAREYAAPALEPTQSPQEPPMRLTLVAELLAIAVAAARQGRRRSRSGLQDPERVGCRADRQRANGDMLTSPVSIEGRHRINIVRRTKSAGAVAHEGAMELHQIVSGAGRMVTGGTFLRPTGGAGTAINPERRQSEGRPGRRRAHSSRRAALVQGLERPNHVSRSPLGREAMTIRSGSRARAASQLR